MARFESKQIERDCEFVWTMPLSVICPRSGSRDHGEIQIRMETAGVRPRHFTFQDYLLGFAEQTLDFDELVNLVADGISEEIPFHSLEVCFSTFLRHAKIVARTVREPDGQDSQEHRDGT